MDDTCVVIDSARQEEFLEHINKIDPHIQFTTEDSKADGSIPFLDTIVKPQPDNSLLTSVYRKPTHSDLYFHWDSPHHLSAKFSVINTLKHKAKKVCSNHHLLKEGRRSPQQSIKKMQVPSVSFKQSQHQSK